MNLASGQVISDVASGIDAASLQLLAERANALQSMMDEQFSEYDECLDNVWMILAAVFVFFMQTGFAMLESGCVRKKNTTSILTKNVLDCAIGFLCWYVVGYALAFGVTESPTKFAGGTNFFMAGFWESKANFRVFFFQGAFCATGGTIVSGAMAERTQLKGFAVFTIIMTSFIYPCIVYWGWSGSGLLNFENSRGEEVSIVGPPLIDFAGSGIVHLSGGMAALIGILVVGPRKEWGEKWAKEAERKTKKGKSRGSFLSLGGAAAGQDNGDSSSEESLGGKSAISEYSRASQRTNASIIRPHGATGISHLKVIQEDFFNGEQLGADVLGTIILWFGWYGFNPGSTAAMKTTDDARIASLVTVNTTLSACAGGLVVVFLRMLMTKTTHLNIEGLCNGLLVGLVSMTAGCAAVRPWEAIIIGMIGGCLYQGCSSFLKWIHLDDVVDAVPVHGAGGVWGIIALGFFGDPADGMGGNGILHGGNQLPTQITVCIIICSWVGICSACVFLPLQALGMLRLSDRDQEVGCGADALHELDGEGEDMPLKEQQEGKLTRQHIETLLDKARSAGTLVLGDGLELPTSSPL